MSMSSSRLVAASSRPSNSSFALTGCADAAGSCRTMLIQSHIDSTAGKLEAGRGRPGKAALTYAYTDSLSVTGFTDTTWRLNFSSESVRPAATPMSCERCRIGIWKSLPVCFFSFDCHASSDR